MGGRGNGMKRYPREFHWRGFYRRPSTRDTGGKSAIEYAVGTPEEIDIDVP